MCVPQLYIRYSVLLASLRSLFVFLFERGSAGFKYVVYTICIAESDCSNDIAMQYFFLICLLMYKEHFIKVKHAALPLVQMFARVSGNFTFFTRVQSESY